MSWTDFSVDIKKELCNQKAKTKVLYPKSENIKQPHQIK